jgi:hypothetical protein
LNPSIVKIVIIINKNLIKNLSPKESRWEVEWYKKNSHLGSPKIRHGGHWNVG